MSQVAFNIISGKVDNTVIKCPWQSIRLIGNFSVQIDALMTKEDLYQFNPVEWHNNLTMGYYRHAKEFYLTDSELAMDPSLKGKLKHPDPKRRNRFTEWTFGVVDEKRYRLAIATQEREDGRYNVSGAKFMRLKRNRVAGLETEGQPREEFNPQMSIDAIYSEHIEM